MVLKWHSCRIKRIKATESLPVNRVTSSDVMGTWGVTVPKSLLSKRKRIIFTTITFIYTQYSPIRAEIEISSWIGATPIGDGTVFPS